MSPCIDVLGCLNADKDCLLLILCSIKLQLLTELLANARRDFRRKLQAYKQMLLCASYTRLEHALFGSLFIRVRRLPILLHSCSAFDREVKLEEARAIVQGSMNRDGAANILRTRSVSWTVAPPPCFLLFSDPKTMETLVRRGVELTLEADPELKALIARQQEHRSQSPRRSSVTFSGGAIVPPTSPSPSPSPSPRNSILKRPTQGNFQLSSTVAFQVDKPMLEASSGTATPNTARDNSQR